MVKPAAPPASDPAAARALHSMTAFALRRGQLAAGPGVSQGMVQSWVWDLRSVNGKGLDLRLRLPDWVEGLEAAVRARLGAALARGSVSVNLRLSREGGAEAFRLNPEGLAAAVTALARARAAAEAAGLAVAPVSPAEILALRGVTESGAAAEGEEEDKAGRATLLSALLADFDALLREVAAMRAAEGAALARLLADQLSQIAALTEAARQAAEARRPAAAEALAAALARVASGAPEADPARVAQELALLAVKADVTEELDRLTAHVSAARALLAEAGPIGRKFDFLCQEFMREANTLCSKAGNPALTAIGLDLKQVIDQMREQVQNVE